MADRSSWHLINMNPVSNYFLGTYLHKAAVYFSEWKRSPDISPPPKFSSTLNLVMVSFCSLQSRGSLSEDCEVATDRDFHAGGGRELREAYQRDKAESGNDFTLSPKRGRVGRSDSRGRERRKKKTLYPNT